MTDSTSTKTLITYEDLQKEARDFVLALRPKTAGATLVTLSGELGAGKTTFVQSVAKALGIHEHITSPTFVLEKKYEITSPETGFTTLIHIDAYRLEGKSLEPLQVAELLKDSKNLIMFEWPEMAPTLPIADVHASFEVLPDLSRNVTYVHHG